MYGIRFTDKKTGRIIKRDQVGLIDRVKLGLMLVIGK